MRPDCVVLLPPALDEHPGLQQRIEDLSIQQFVAQLSRRCVERGWLSTRQARRWETFSRPSTLSTWSTARRRFVGLRSFPRRPPVGSPCPVPLQPRASSAWRSPSPAPSAASPGPSAGRRTPSASGSTSARLPDHHQPPSTGNSNCRQTGKVIVATYHCERVYWRHVTCSVGGGAAVSRC